MVDQWMNDCLVTYIKTDAFDSIDNEVIMKRFQNIKTLLCTFLKICLYLTFVEGIVLIFWNLIFTCNMILLNEFSIVHGVNDFAEKCKAREHSP